MSVSNGELIVFSFRTWTWLPHFLQEKKFLFLGFFVVAYLTTCALMEEFRPRATERVSQGYCGGRFVIQAISAHDSRLTFFVPCNTPD